MDEPRKVMIWIMIILGGLILQLRFILMSNTMGESADTTDKPTDTTDKPTDTMNESVTAMTWIIANHKHSEDNQHHYALVASDQTTNPYTGDTPISEDLPILCIKKAELVKPTFINPTQTPGGAWRQTWSGGYIGFTDPISGKELTSLSIANQICSNKFGDGYRMAEFHDGDPSLWAGWDFWGELISEIPSSRFWVSINDQSSNPWGSN